MIIDDFIDDILDDYSAGTSMAWPCFSRLVPEKAMAVEAARQSAAHQIDTLSAVPTTTRWAF